jgi:serine phosphatase RsbU (regulator of sigma subunit)
VAGLIGRRWTEVYPDVVESPRLEAYARVLETGAPLDVPELSRVQAAGGKRWVGWYQFRATKVDDYIVFAYRDITEQRAREEQWQQERAQAQSLQEAFLPAVLPGAEDLEVAAVYLPARDAPMGGDWYDAFPVDGGMCFVLGDVAGHGLRPAALMGQLRNAARAFADESPAPADVLRRLNRMLCRLEPDETASAVVARWDAAARTFVWSSAGHPPVLRCRTGEFGFLGTEPGPMLGADPHAAYGQELKLLRPGTTLLFYTDGLIELRGVPIDEGMHNLRQVVEKLDDLTPQVVCDAVLEWRIGADRREDDLCVLAVRLA